MNSAVIADSPVPNVNRSPRQTAATREAPAAVWRRAGGLVGHSMAFALCKTLTTLGQFASSLNLGAPGALRAPGAGEKRQGRHTLAKKRRPLIRLDPHCDYSHQDAGKSNQNRSNRNSGVQLH